MEIPQTVHNPVSCPDNRGKNIGSQKETNPAAQHRRASRVKQIFSHNRALAVAQGLQNTNLRPLLLHHTGHGSDTHQRRNQKEENREYIGNPLHDIRIAFKACVTDIFIPAQHIGIRLLQIGQLFPGILQFLTGVSRFILKLLPVLLVLLPAVRQLLFRILQLLLGIPQLFLLARYGILRRLQLPASHICLGKAGFHLGLFALYLGLRQIQAGFITVLFISLLHIGGFYPLFLQLLQAVLYLLLSILKLRQGIHQLLPLIRDLRLTVRYFLPAIGNLLPGIFYLLFPVQQLLPGILQLILRLGHLLIKLPLAVCNLPLGILLQPHIPCLGHLLTKRLRPVHDLIDVILILLAVKGIFLLQPDKNLRISFRVKPCLRNINIPLQLAVSKRRTPSFIIDIKRGVTDPHNFILRTGKHIPDIFLIIIGNTDCSPDILSRKYQTVHHALIRCRRHSPGPHHHMVLHPKQRMRPQHAFCPFLVLGQEIHINRALRDLHTLPFIQLLHIAFIKTHRGQQTQVIQIILLQVFPSGLQHGRLCHLKARKKSNPQRHNSQNGHVPSEAFPDFPYSCLEYGGLHRIPLPYHSISSTGVMCSFISILRIVPLFTRIIRSAMAVMA